jgi:hypothetical protein
MPIPENRNSLVLGDRITTPGIEKKQNKTKIVDQENSFSRWKDSAQCEKQLRQKFGNPQLAKSLFNLEIKE